MVFRFAGGLRRQGFFGLDDGNQPQVDTFHEGEDSGLCKIERVLPMSVPSYLDTSSRDAKQLHRTRQACRDWTDIVYRVSADDNADDTNHKVPL